MWILLLSALLVIIFINVSAYLWAYFKQSDHLTDISYSMCFAGVTIFLLLYDGSFTAGKLIMSLMVITWAMRLGIYLLVRIKKMRKDRRFDSFRGNWLGFLKFWILQSVSIWIIALPAMLFLLKDNPEYWLPGVFIWLIGFMIEAVADAQKFHFKLRHHDAFMDKGLFSIIKYPNYLGEILCWIGIFAFTIPVLNGIDWVAVLSPVWITLLLLFISGIPLLEKQYEEKYGNDIAYKQYNSRTKKLLPMIY